MKSLHALRLLALAGIAPLVSTAALAQSESYYYGGLSIGSSRAKLPVEAITADQAGPGVTASAISRDDHDTGYKVFGGYQMNRNFGVELGFFKLGKFGFNSTTVPAGTLDGRVRFQGANLDLVGTLPMTERWSALARVGATYTKTRDTFDGTGAVVVLDRNPSHRETNIKVGAGLQYAFNPSMLMRAEVEHHRVNDAVNHRLGVNMASLSLVFPFGRAETPAPRAAAVMPAYVAPAPVVEAPAPVIVAAAPPPPPAPVIVPLRRVSFSAESLFGFDKSDVKADGRTALDGFARKMAGTKFETITVEGHTDRLGSTAYNQKLSLERADAVKSYLVTQGKLDPNKISAVGKSESSPVTKPEDCKGKTANAALIACLQPDRRVEIEVSGTR